MKPSTGGDSEDSDWPDWVQDAIESETLRLGPLGRGVDVLTSEGLMFGDDGEWLIQGVKGEIYVCKPDIFDLTYEPAQEAVAVGLSVEKPIVSTRA